MLALVAQELLRELLALRAGLDLAAVLLLGLHHRLADLDRVEFVFTDTPREDFLLAVGGIEVPFALAFNQRDGHRPVVGAQVEENAAIVFGDEPMHLIVGRSDPRFRSLIRDRVAGNNDWFGAG